MSEQEEAIKELLAMSPNELAKVDHDGIRWTCCVEGCERYTYVRDYGVAPYYYWRKKFQKFDNHRFYCGKHWQYFKRVPNKLVYKYQPHILS